MVSEEGRISECCKKVSGCSLGHGRKSWELMCYLELEHLIIGMLVNEGVRMGVELVVISSIQGEASVAWPPRRMISDHAS